MHSRLRHDLSDPIAMVSMIASALREFSGVLDDDAVGKLRRDIQHEMSRAEDLFAAHKIALDISSLRELADRLVGADFDFPTEQALQRECIRLIEALGER